MQTKRQFGPDIAKYLTKPVIPYVTDGSESLNAIALASASIIFVGGSELAELPALLERLGKGPLSRIPVFLHMDLLSGLSNDESGLRYIAGLPRVDGIITVRHHLAPAARKLGLMSVVRLFLQDGRAVDRGVGVVEKSHPDAVEVLPGVAFLEVPERFKGLGLPVIAGGLIRTPDIVRRIRAAGCLAVSTTNTELWTMNTGR